MFPMISQFITRCWLVVGVCLFTAMPVWAQEGGAGDEPQVWVLQYLIMIFFLALALLILLRPTKREDSAFTYDELKAEKEEDLKKITGK